MTFPKIKLISAPEWRDYELLDSGDGAKLERFGSYTFVRPEHHAVWKRSLPAETWQMAHASFQATTGEETGGRWQIRKAVPEVWNLRYKKLTFHAHFSSSRHLGVFPEQAAHWDWMVDLI